MCIKKFPKKASGGEIFWLNSSLLSFIVLIVVDKCILKEIIKDYLTLNYNLSLLFWSSFNIQESKKRNFRKQKEIQKRIFSRTATENKIFCLYKDKN